MLTRSRHRRLVLASSAAVTVLALAGCSSSSSSSSGGSGGPAASGSSTAPVKDDTLAALVPAAISSTGKIVVGTDASYAPNEFVDTDGKTIVGFDVDLGKAIGDVLGSEGRLQERAVRLDHPRAFSPASTTSASPRSP